MNKSLRIFILAGESSGDILGASLIRALRKRFPNLQVEGVAGKQMLQEHCQALYSIDELSLMGIIEPIMHLPRLFKMRRALQKYILKTRPDIFIGIDAPDFNLGLEENLRKAGIKVVHYVSPSVWAWRRYRINKIKRAVDLMLTLFPFELAIYQQHNIPAKFVGHPLADEIPLISDTNLAREQLGLKTDVKILAIMPGSREVELKYLAKNFILTAQQCLRYEPQLIIITNMVNQQRNDEFKRYLLANAPLLPIKIFIGQAHQVMSAADYLLLTSGTVTLEAMLYKKPMVVAYRLSPIIYWLLKLLVKIKYFSLPNLIAQEELVPEFLQDKATPTNLAKALLDQMNHPEKIINLKNRFTELHKQLQCDAAEKAAGYIAELLNH